jgi:hypothetical protein
MKSNKSIDDLFREKLQRFEQSPPPGLFEEVLAGIAAERSRRRLLFWRLAAVAAALLLAFIAGWQFSNRDQKLTTPPVYTGQNTSASDRETNTSPENKTTEAIRGNGKSTAEEAGRLNLLNEQTGILKANQPVASLTGGSQNTKNQSLLRQNSEPPQSIVPIKSLFRLLEQTKNQDEFREKKILDAHREKLIKTIDQQIMEQNQKNYLAALTASQRGRWLIGAQVSPAYNLEHGSYSQAYASNMIVSSSMNPIDLGGGLSVEYKTGKKLSLQSGIYYAGIGLSSGSSSRSMAMDFISSNGAADYFNAPVTIEADKVMMNSSAGVIEMNQIPSNATIGTSMDDKSFASTVLVSDAQFIQNFQYLEVPLYLRYALFNSRFDIEMLGGFSTNFLIGNDAYLQNGSSKSLVGTTRDMRTFNYSGTLGIGFKYGINKHFYLNVEPRVKYFLNSLNTNSSVKYKPYIFGIYTGVSYEF